MWWAVKNSRSKSKWKTLLVVAQGQTRQNNEPTMLPHPQKLELVDVPAEAELNTGYYSEDRDYDFEF